MATMRDVLMMHPTNPVEITGAISSSNKSWTEEYDPITNLRVHTRVVQGGIIANYPTACLPFYADDHRRLSSPSILPNPTSWTLKNEADIECWFFSEICQIVRGAWLEAPLVVFNKQARPPGEVHKQAVDSVYIIKPNGDEHVLMIGEAKRNLIEPEAWQYGNVLELASQTRFSQELRG
ncbi:hypothetical protein CDD80_1604 [Ophiocordyceps camponoti-rufipedis]|uniref:Uncharacterized protein n=1 Tax=Ophiocordyceps camponoti-rufipedis TaxID=2004952 RepID=A0A2C5Z3C9_9HYPO|nr:hypothetical protein CDD80_1604 [Ophiocordyceps camponoti-rufipedis]